MKTLIFDTGPIISLTVNNLLTLLEPLKKTFKGQFLITPAVHAELVSTPLASKKYKFEALQVQKQIEQGVLSVFEDQRLIEKGTQLLETANNVFSAHDQSLTICQYAEMQTLAACNSLSAPAVIDERITRMLVEQPLQLRKLLEKRLHTSVRLNQHSLDMFQEQAGRIKIIRSVELVTIAYEKKLLDEYLVNVPGVRRALLESVLWGVKVHGAAVSEEEIEELLKIEKVM